MRQSALVFIPLALMAAIFFSGCSGVQVNLYGYGRIASSARQAKFAVLYGTPEKALTFKDKTIGRNLAKQFVKEANEGNFQARAFDFNKNASQNISNWLRDSKGGAFVILLYAKVSKHKVKIHSRVFSIRVPGKTYETKGRIYGDDGKTYRYMANTTETKEKKMIIPGWTETRHCHSLTVQYYSPAVLLKQGSEPVYLQEINICEENNDIRLAAEDLIKSAFDHFGEEGKFQDETYVY